MNAFENCQSKTGDSVENCQPKPVNCGCGGEAYIFRGENRNWIFCVECHTESKPYETVEKAITAWNKAMGERTAKVKEGWGLAMCCACKKRVLPCDKYCSHCGARLEWE